MEKEGFIMSETSNSAENTSDSIDLIYKRLLRVLGVLGKRWNYVEEILLWKKTKHSISWLLIVNILFVFIATHKLRVYIVVVAVVLISIYFDVVRNKAWEGLEAAGILSMPLQDESDKTKFTSFEDFCKVLARCLDKCGQCYNSLCELRKNSKRKFFAVIFCVLSVLALFFHHAPVVTLSYLLVMSGMIWPALGYYGLRGKISSKMRPVFHPIMVQWKYNRTKRQRNKTLRTSSVNQSICEESEDDEFTLDAEQEAALTKALTDTFEPPAVRSSSSQSDDLRSTGSSWGSNWNPMHSDTNSSQTFTEGMVMPSLGDSIDLSMVQDFAQGLEFPDIDKSYSSSMDSLHMIDDETLIHDDGASHTSVSTPNTTDNPGFSDQTDDDHGSGHNDQSRSTEVHGHPIWFQENGTLIKHRLPIPAQINRENLLGRLSLESHSQQSSTSSDFTDYEMLDHSELDGVNTEDTPPRSPGLGVTQFVSSGLSYMGKWVGYK